MVTELIETTATTAYNLFMYRNELHVRNVHYLKRVKIKATLTDHLIINAMENIREASKQELKMASRELKYSRKLKKQLSRMSQLRAMGFSNPKPSYKLATKEVNEDED